MEVGPTQQSPKGPLSVGHFGLAKAGSRGDAGRDSRHRADLGSFPGRFLGPFHRRPRDLGAGGLRGLTRPFRCTECSQRPAKEGAGQRRHGLPPTAYRTTAPRSIQPGETACWGVPGVAAADSIHTCSLDPSVHVQCSDVLSSTPQASQVELLMSPNSGGFRRFN